MLLSAGTYGRASVWRRLTALRACTHERGDSCAPVGPPARLRVRAEGRSRGLAAFTRPAYEKREFGIEIWRAYHGKAIFLFAMAFQGRWT